MLCWKSFPPSAVTWMSTNHLSLPREPLIKYRFRLGMSSCTKIRRTIFTAIPLEIKWSSLIKISYGLRCRLCCEKFLFISFPLNLNWNCRNQCFPISQLQNDILQILLYSKSNKISTHNLKKRWTKRLDLYWHSNKNNV